MDKSLSKKLRDEMMIRNIVRNVFLRVENSKIRKQLRDEQWFKFALKLLVLPAHAKFTDDNLLKAIVKKFAVKKRSRR